MAKLEEVQACEVCGASIYPEMIKKRAADYLAGKLLCPHCLEEKRQIAIVNPAAVFKDDKPADDDDEPIALAIDEETEESDGAATQIQTMGGGGISGATAYGAPVVDQQCKRPLLTDSRSATRCRTFHCKMTDSSMAHMNDMINEWVDNNPEIEIKFATTCIGNVEGKSSYDSHLIITIFY